MYKILEDLFSGKMEREVFHYMKYDNAPMPYNDDNDFESALVENYTYDVPQVCA